MTNLFQILAAALAGGSVAIFWMFAEARRQRKLSMRTAPQFSEWYELYYGTESGLAPQMVKAVIEAVSCYIGVEATKLRPTDRLDCELAICEAGTLDDTIDGLEESLSAAFATGITVRPGWNTVDDLIRGVAEIKGKDAQRPGDTTRLPGLS